MNTKSAKASVEKIKPDKEEINKVNVEVQDSDLNSVNGGADIVNPQITDAVT